METTFLSNMSKGRKLTFPRLNKVSEITMPLKDLESELNRPTSNSQGNYSKESGKRSVNYAILHIRCLSYFSFSRNVILIMDNSHYGTRQRGARAHANVASEVS